MAPRPPFPQCSSGRAEPLVVGVDLQGGGSRSAALQSLIAGIEALTHARETQNRAIDE